jgi:hypothetical protein
MSGLSHIIMELAREPGHPLGDREHAYHLYLPLTEDGRIDARACRKLAHACRVRRFRPGEAEARGLLVRGPGGRWVLDYDDTGSRDNEIGFRFGEERFTPGEYVSVREDDGKMHTFQIITVRNE